MASRRRTLLLAALVALALAGLALWRISGLPCTQLVGSVTCRVETSERVVALTFDDGPTPRGVDAVLPILRSHGARATFFLIGRDMARHPGQAERLLAAGHELGNHTWSHQRNVGHLPQFYRQEVARADALLRRAGARPTLFRPPYGKRLIGLPQAVDRAGYRMVTWDVDDAGLGQATPQAYATAILAQVRPGSIMLMHPMYRGNASARAALPLVLAGLKARGYRVVTVSELLAMEPGGSSRRYISTTLSEAASQE